MFEKARLPLEQRTKLGRVAESIMDAGLKCVVEVDDDTPGTPGWEPRLVVLSPDSPPESAVEAVEDTMRTWPAAGVRLAAYTPCRLRRVEDFPTHLCKEAVRLETAPANGRATAVAG